MEKSVLLIGLGRFGRYTAKKLHELDIEVMAVDKDEERVNKVLDYTTNAVISAFNVPITAKRNIWVVLFNSFPIIILSQLTLVLLIVSFPNKKEHLT